MLSHLDPVTISSVSLVCKSFYTLVTAPDAWRTAFARYFPGASIIKEKRTKDVSMKERIKSGRRLFCRLTIDGRWREEYVIRAHLLRSLEKGRPAVQRSPSSPSSGSHSSNSLSPITLNEGTIKTAITNVDVQFDIEGVKNGLSIILGSWFMGQSRLSNPIMSSEVNLDDNKLDRMKHFSNLFPHEAMYGLGAGRFVGCDNPMDVSRTYGMILGAGHPGGMVWLRGIQDFRNFLVRPCDAMISGVVRNHRSMGIPDMLHFRESITSVWIAKSSAIPALSEGMVGVLTGTSLGIVSSYSLGIQGMRDRHIKTGDLTARWVLSPGIPIVAIAVDNDYSLKRQSQNRIWAVALNALGEVFYLTKFPKRSREEFPPAAIAEANAWLSGRSVYWNLAEPTRRVARPNYEDDTAYNSYSPRSSWNGMCLSESQIDGETMEIEQYMIKTPADFRKMCHGWDMQRNLLVDFAGDDGNFAGESIIVVTSGYGDETKAEVQRFVRCRIGSNAEEQTSRSDSGYSTPRSPSERFTSRTDSRISTPRASESAQTLSSSIFGTPVDTPSEESTRSFGLDALDSSPSSNTRLESSPERRVPVEEWRTSILATNNTLPVHYTTAALDCSRLSTITISEDPIFAQDEDSSDTSSQNGSSSITDVALVPGQRARFLAVGTDTGAVFVWDVRRSIPRTSLSGSPLLPVREIYTDSPSISSLALTSLYLVHGGSDGLVQAWDPLASRTEPIRTISGRPNGRFRRQIVRSQAIALSTRGFPTAYDYNQFAAATIALDPDASALRGVVTIGSLVRAWSFRSSDLERRLQPRPGTKRRLRRSSERHGVTGKNVVGAGSGVHHIKRELADVRLEQRERLDEKKRLAKRFGLGMFGTSGEDEEMRLAMLMSEESFEMESSRNSSVVDTPRGDELGTKSKGLAEDNDDDVAEAIRRSLLDAMSDSITPSPPAGRSWSQVASPSIQSPDVDHDLELAMLLSLQEQEQSSNSGKIGNSLETELDDSQNGYPTLPSGDENSERSGSVKTKGKGKSVW
jgi:hypothetical protein